MLNESQAKSPTSPTHQRNANGHSRGPKSKAPAQLERNPQNDERLFATQVERTARIFEVISAHSDIDHPICVDCTEMMMEGLQKQLAVATKERDAYISFLKSINSSIPSEEEIKTAEETLQATLKAEAEAFEQLQELEKEKREVDREVAELEEESRKLDLEEEQFWRDRNDFALTLSGFQNERDSLNVKFDHDSRQLERLQRTNVYNDAFCISHDGYFGTINGLRLGRLTSHPVEWPEINAAWGQTLLLLATIAEKLAFQFQGYKLRPMGSTSRIDKIEYTQQQQQQLSPPPPSPEEAEATNTGTQDPSQRANQSPKVTTLDLFSSGDLPLNLPWIHRRFDAGMVAFLECLRQLGAHVENTQTNISSPATATAPRPTNPSRRSGQQTKVAGLELPYEIKRDKIGDASIKLGFNQNDETWTRACKFTLTCCKFLLAHTSNLAAVRSSG